MQATMTLAYWDFPIRPETYSWVEWVFVLTNLRASTQPHSSISSYPSQLLFETRISNFEVSIREGIDSWEHSLVLIVANSSSALFFHVSPNRLWNSIDRLGAGLSDHPWVSSPSEILFFSSLLIFILTLSFILQVIQSRLSKPIFKWQFIIRSSRKLAAVLFQTLAILNSTRLFTSVALMDPS